MNFDENDLMIKRLEEYAGPLVSELAQNRIMTTQYVNDGNPKLRFAALSLITTFWGVTEEIAEKCKDIAINDTDENVRGVAVICLYDYYKKKNNRIIGNLLASIVYDETEVSDVRRVAYEGLFHLREEHPLNWPLPIDFNFPNDVDWTFVDIFLFS